MSKERIEEFKPVKIIERPEWKQFVNKYLTTYLQANSILLDDIIAYSAHANNKSVVAHSLAKHFHENRELYSKNPYYEYYILRAAALECLFSLKSLK